MIKVNRELPIIQNKIHFAGFANRKKAKTYRLPGQQFDLPHDFLVGLPVSGVEADPFDCVVPVVQLVLYLNHCFLANVQYI